MKRKTESDKRTKVKVSEIEKNIGKEIRSELKQKSGNKRARVSEREKGISKEIRSELKQKKKHPVIRNREFMVVAYLFVGIFVAMTAYFVYFQVFRSEDVINSPYNKRQESFAKHVVRGEILSADGKVLAQTKVSEDGSESRNYPYGAMFAHAVGYAVNGMSGMESFANFSLLRSHAFFLERLVNGFQNQKSPGDNLVSTLDYSVQEAAYNALGKNKGAVVVMEPSTGKILAWVSKPDFDPNTIEKDWSDIVSDADNSVLLNRVSQGLYPPGSTFKILTALEYIHENTNYADFTFDCKGHVTEGETTIHCYKGAVHGHEDFTKAFAKSCNSAFATIGLSLDKNAFIALCTKMLFQTDLPTTYPSKQSKFALTADTGDGMVMQTAIGQGETLMTPLHLALITAAIANDGVLMTPYVLDHTENNTGIRVHTYQPSVYLSLLTKEETTALKVLMDDVVEEGTGRALLGASYKAAGKTGSAEFNNVKGESHAWFTGFADGGEKGKLVVTVIVEGGGSGSETAVPVAKQVFDTYFGK
ncbi:beta-lactamase [Clostridia bacterium]|nr:beta-lactamase [Clostridia bacterium]